MAHKTRNRAPARPFGAVLGARRRVVIPSEVCKMLAIAPGDRLVFTVGEDGRVALASLRQQVRKGRGMLAHLKRPGERVVDDFLRERRTESERE